MSVEKLGDALVVETAHAKDSSAVDDIVALAVQVATGAPVQEAVKNEVDLSVVKNEVDQFVALKDRLRARRQQLLSEAARIDELLGESAEIDALPAVKIPRQKRQAPQAVRTGLTIEVESFVTEHPGATFKEVHEALGSDKNKIMASLTRLKHEGRIKSTGEKRSYQYHPVKSR